jgi:NAD-dependent SIR2 family protein deacetylase
MFELRNIGGPIHGRHFDFKCSMCRKKLGGCRCFAPDKEVRWTICENCVADTLARPHDRADVANDRFVATAETRTRA